jgi:hypothetical protein
VLAVLTCLRGASSRRSRRERAGPGARAGARSSRQLALRTGRSGWPGGDDAGSAVVIAASIFLDVFNVFLLLLDLFGGSRD